MSLENNNNNISREDLEEMEKKNKRLFKKILLNSERLDNAEEGINNLQYHIEALNRNLDSINDIDLKIEILLEKANELIEENIQKNEILIQNANKKLEEQNSEFEKSINEKFKEKTRRTKY